MPKRSYSLAFKQNAVHTALNSSNRSAAHAVGVYEKRICEWRSQLPLLQQQTSASRSAAKKRCRFPGGGRNPLLPEVEQTVADWVVLLIEMTSNGWMQATTTLAWIEKCWGKIAFSKRMLVWDSFQAHITDEVCLSAHAILAVRAIKSITKDTVVLSANRIYRIYRISCGVYLRAAFIS